MAETARNNATVTAAKRTGRGIIGPSASYASARIACESGKDIGITRFSGRKARHSFDRKHAPL
ncbi:hypothetical protein D3P04_01445 [Paracoccus onubensis]|uniref:Uncharacterized protein n=1 Tax=Paracoccus onubensis TaxID=1675788 RepID=A0A418T7X6_9RHOB|nr:hypothetical protein D3P04_01445 [Paracoccus onubensis]